MAEAALIGTSGSWSPDAVLASFGSRIDRLNDQTPIADQGGTGPAAAFERALADELKKAGDVDPFDFGPDPQNGAVLDKAGEGRWMSAQAAAADLADMDVVDSDTVAWSSRRVGFGDDDGSSRLSGGGGDRFDRGFEADDEAAFWIGDRVASHPAYKGRDLPYAEDALVQPASIGQVFFNGDGRPIVLPSMDLGDRDAADVDETLSADGDLMILPNGAVVAYDPWTVTIDGLLREGVSTH